MTRRPSKKARQRTTDRAPINPNRYAQTLRELATLLSAAIPPAEAWRRLESAMDLPHYTDTLKKLESGQPFTQAFQTTQILTSGEAVMLKASEFAGRLPEALRRLAIAHEARYRRYADLNTRCYLLFTLLALMFAGSTLYVYFVHADHWKDLFVENIFKAAGLFALVHLVQVLNTKSSWWWLDKAFRRNHFHRSIIQQAFTAHWIRLLGWQLDSGVDAKTALANQRNLMSARRYQRAMGEAIAEIQSGKSLLYALERARLIIDPGLRFAMSTGESAGRLSQTLQHESKLAQERLDSQIDTITFFTPKILYVIFMLVGFTMFNFRLMPSIPY